MLSTGIIKEMAGNLSLRTLVGITFGVSLGVVAACGGSGSSAVDPKIAYSGVYVGAYTRADGQIIVSVANKQAEATVLDSDSGVFQGSGNISSNGHFGFSAANPDDLNVPPASVNIDANATSAGSRFMYNVALTGSGAFNLPATPVTYVGVSLPDVFAGTYDGTFSGTKSGTVRFLVTLDGKMKAIPVVDGTEVTGTTQDFTSVRNLLPFTANSTNGSFNGYFRYVSSTNKTFNGTWTLGADSGTFTATIIN